MRLIVGLGNPEEKYRHTRHNAGFAALDHVAAQHSTAWQLKDKFKSEIAEVTQNGEKALLIKPQTYYNLSGEAVRTIADFYKVPSADILIVHDELALPFGTVRTRLGGSPAGNNGIKSINEHLGPDTARIRIGIMNELRESMDDADFVLSRFSKEEMDQLTVQYKKIVSLIDAFIAGTFEPTTHS